MELNFILNGREMTTEVPKGISLLWFLREYLNLTGTKYGCGIGQCEACTVHINGSATKACLTPASSIGEKEVTTIEGVSDKGHPLLKAWIDIEVPQCGYCQSGQIMQAAALLEKNKKPTREEIVSHMNGVLCRCGTYVRIIKAIERAAQGG